MAISSLLLAGCAGAPTSSSYPSDPAAKGASLPTDLGSLPQTTLPGASRSEVMSLAMGAARSKGWSVTSTGGDRIVITRAIDSAISPPDGPNRSGPPIPPGSTLEVTSFFADQGGGVKVATKAEVVAPAREGRPPARIDYTPYYNDALAQSLDALRHSWSANRGRLARATPPADGWDDPWAGTPYARDNTPKPETPSTPAAASEPVVEPVEIAEREPVEETRTEMASSEMDRPMAERPITDRPSPNTSPRPIQDTRPRAASSQPPRPPISSRPAYQPSPLDPRRQPATGAPVVDATQVLGTQSPSRDRLYPEPKVVPRNSMLSLPSDRGAAAPSAEAVSWAAYAEQYARQHGCRVSGGGAQLIESRRDGELHKVPCEGTDSFLVKCQNGVCQGVL